MLTHTNTKSKKLFTRRRLCRAKTAWGKPSGKGQKTRHPPSSAKATAGQEEILKRLHCFAKKNKEEKIKNIQQKSAERRFFVVVLLEISPYFC
jgi:hypothetical protein